MSVERPERFTGGCLCGSVRIVASRRPYRAKSTRGGGVLFVVATAGTAPRWAERAGDRPMQFA
jgi:hypothetical protein